MSSRRSIALAAATLALALPALPAGAAPIPSDVPVGGIMIDDQSAMATDCQELTGPGQTSTAHILGADAVSLDVLVLVDTADGFALQQQPTDTPQQQADVAAQRTAITDGIAEVLDSAAIPYDEIDVDLTTSFDLLDAYTATGAVRERTDNAQELIDLGKAQVGGARPDDIDLVYVATDLDIQLPGLGNAVAGLADCIGGVELDDRAFAVGEIEINDTVFGPAQLSGDAAAKVFAHELGHLMGAHHHYQTCGDGARLIMQTGDIGPCTIMTNAVNFAAAPFSQTNSIVVRGHAETWASANDDS